MFRGLTTTSFWTNFFFLIPLGLSMYYEDYSLVIAIGSLFIISGLYHLFKNPGIDSRTKAKRRSFTHNFLLWADTSFSALLTVWIFFIFYIRGLPTQFFVASFLVIVSLPLLFVTQKNYDKRHALWHVAVSLVIVLAIVS